MADSAAICSLLSWKVNFSDSRQLVDIEKQVRNLAQSTCCVKLGMLEGKKPITT